MAQPANYETVLVQLLRGDLKSFPVLQVRSVIDGCDQNQLFRSAESVTESQ